MTSSAQRLLLIDDSRAVHALVRETLAPRGITLESCYNGREGVELLRRDRGFDLILLDWEMPVMDGPSALAEIRAMGIKTSLSMMTSRNSMEDIKRMLMCGADDYIIKPFTRDILLERISQLGLRVA